MSTAKMFKVAMQERFGHFCGAGSQAVELLRSEVYPHLDGGGVVEFDFNAVRNMNSSFGNALFANLVRRYGDDVVCSVKITNAKPNIRSEILSSLSLGSSDSSGRRAEA